jgi:hypothetical protein
MSLPPHGVLTVVSSCPPTSPQHQNILLCRQPAGRGRVQDMQQAVQLAHMCASGRPPTPCACGLRPTRRPQTCNELQKLHSLALHGKIASIVLAPLALTTHRHWHSRQ